MLPVSKGMLSLGMLLAEVAGMLPLEGMLQASVSAMLKNSASAAFTPAEYIKPFLDISPFCSQKAISACSTAGSR
jgi:hypothetical protein